VVDTTLWKPAQPQVTVVPTVTVMEVGPQLIAPTSWIMAVLGVAVLVGVNVRVKVGVMVDE
jgi:hypothetical protein